MVSKHRLWLFRSIAVIGALGVGGGAAWLVWQARQVLSPSEFERAENEFANVVKSLPPTSQILFDVAGYGPNGRLVLRANFDAALVFSNQVIERDAQVGYRFRPCQTNLWVRPEAFPNQTLIPDTESVRQAVRQAKASITASERINSFGCRGPEWGDLERFRFRVLVLGDSFTEGILVEEPDTFCARLELLLDERTALEALVANSGVIGYSTEQEYFRLRELAPRLHPHVVVLCFYANDVHYDHEAVLRSRKRLRGWDTAREWLERCAYFCKAAGIQFVVATIPDRSQMSSRSTRFNYQHRLEAIASELGIYLIDPDDRFLAHRVKALWLSGDAHFSAIGHALFAEALAEHVEQWARRQID